VHKIVPLEMPKAVGRESDPSLFKAKVCVHRQAALEKMGIDSSSAVERARARSQSRVGRKRTRSQGPTDMEVDGGEGSQAPEKRIHSGKSRYPVAPLPAPNRTLHPKPGDAPQQVACVMLLQISIYWPLCMDPMTVKAPLPPPPSAMLA